MVLLTGVLDFVEDCGFDNPFWDSLRTIVFLFLRKTHPNRDLNSGPLEKKIDNPLPYHLSYLTLNCHCMFTESCHFNILKNYFTDYDFTT